MLDVLVDSARRRVGRVFYGWWIVAAGFAIQALSGGLLFHGFTIYFLPLQAEFGWSRTLLATVFTMTRFESAILGPAQGWAIDRFGPRIIVLVGVLIFGSGFMVMSRMQSLPMFFFAFLLLAMGSSLGGFLPVTATVANWFSVKRSLAMGIAMSGMGVGGMTVVALAWSITSYGWRPTAVVSGVLVWLIGIPAAMLLRHKPEQYGYLPDGRHQSSSSQHDGTEPISGGAPAIQKMPLDESFSAREAMRTSAFWTISVGHAFAVMVVSTVSIHQVPHMVQRVGLSLEAAGAIVAFLLAVTVMGQLGGGYLADRFNKRALLVSCMLGHMLGLLILAYATTVGHLLLFAIFHGLAWGVRGPTQNSIRADYFGRNSFATIMGFSSLVVMVGMTIGPIFAGWLADRQDSYTLPFSILAVTAGFGSVSFLLIRKPKKQAATR